MKIRKSVLLSICYVARNLYRLFIKYRSVAVTVIKLSVKNQKPYNKDCVDFFVFCPALSVFIRMRNGLHAGVTEAQRHIICTEALCSKDN